MNKTISQQIKILGLLCTVFVVYRHSYTDKAFFNTDMVPIYMQMTRGVVSRLTCIAVPVFFLISGYFFFKYNYYEKGEYINMIRKKTKTLLIPFIIWNIISGILLYFTHSTLLGNSAIELIINCLNSKWYGPLWYVRDLILLMLLVPFYGWIIYKKKYILQSILICVLLYLWQPVASNVLSYEGILFFFLGGILSHTKKFLEYKIDNFSFVILLIIWLIVALFPYLLLGNLLFYKIYNIIGIFLTWQLVKRKCGYNIFIIHISKYVFLIYVTHVFVLKFIKEIIALIFYGNGIAAMIVYLLSPLASILFIYILGSTWERYHSKSYNIALGGR